MASCPVCGSVNRAGSRFCNECGRRLDGTVKCVACGQENPADARFCGECGGDLGTTRPAVAPAAGVSRLAEKVASANGSASASATAVAVAPDPKPSTVVALPVPTELVKPTSGELTPTIQGISTPEAAPVA